MIELKNVTFSYDRKKNVLENINLYVKNAQMIGLIGHNAAGKTTLLRIILGLLKPQIGEVKIETNQDLYKNRNKFVAYMPENNGVYERLNAFENLQFWARIANIPEDIIFDKANDILKSLNLYKKSNEKVGFWSNGMKKRLSLACALIREPELLLLDEPTNGLDPESLEIIISLLKQKNKSGTAVIISSHDLNIIYQICESVLIMQNGRLIFSGKVNSIDGSLKNFYFTLNNRREESV